MNRETEAGSVKLFFAGRGHGRDMGGEGWGGRWGQKGRQIQGVGDRQTRPRGCPAGGNHVFTSSSSPGVLRLSLPSPPHLGRSLPLISRAQG